MCLLTDLCGVVSDKNKPMFGQSRAAGVEMFCVVYWCLQSLCSGPQPKLVVGSGSGLIKGGSFLVKWLMAHFEFFFFLLFWRLLPVCFWEGFFWLCFVFHCVVLQWHARRFFCTVTQHQQHTSHITLMLKIQHWPTRRNVQTHTQSPAKIKGRSHSYHKGHNETQLSASCLECLCEFIYLKKKKTFKFKQKK